MWVAASLALIGLVFVGAVKGQYREPHWQEGRSTLVHLFEWRWDDIADECERFLGPYGYGGIQISPATENAIVTDPYRPWWERYQPVSYHLTTRSGDEAALVSMIQRCHAANVTVYADIIINHMSGGGRRGRGTGGSDYNGGTLDFPAVPYSSTDFNNGANCHSRDGHIHDYNNAEEVRNCRLENLVDLALHKEYVRGKLVDYLNHLLDLGVAGFRVDTSKHMWPGDMKIVFGRLKNVRTDMFGAGKRPFILQEVIDQGNEAITGDEYLETGRITNFKFGQELARVFRRQNPMKYLSNFPQGWGEWSGNDVVNFVDNHDNQRGHGGAGGVITHREPREYKLVSAFMLAHPYGIPRVMSSYRFSDDAQGPPNIEGVIRHVTFNSDLSCAGEWVCEHRWRQIYNMVAFRNVAGLEPLTNWWSGADYQIAFSRGNRAFVAFNLEGHDLSARLQTGLPAGTYCDVISGHLQGGGCTGKEVVVGPDGTADVTVCSSCEDPMIAIHVGAQKYSTPSRIG